MLNLNASYAVTVDHAAQTAVLRELNVAGTQNGNPLLTARLTRPMNLTGERAPAEREIPRSIWPSRI